MDKDFYQRKMHLRFDTFDSDNDGAITQRDVDAMANRVLSEFGLNAQSAKGAAVINGADHLWQSLTDAADADRNGSITPTEFKQGAIESMFGSPDGFTRAAQPWAEAIVAVADTDNDGRLSSAEYARMLRAMGAEDAAVKAITPYLADSDGSVSADAVMNTALEFYTSDKPYNPATWAFGKF